MSNIRTALVANTARALNCTLAEASTIEDLFPGHTPERIALDQEAGRGWIYFQGEKCPVTLGTCPRSARLLASLLGR